MHDLSAVVWTNLADRADDELHEFAGRGIDDLRLLVHLIATRLHEVTHNEL